MLPNLEDLKMKLLDFPTTSQSNLIAFLSRWDLNNLCTLYRKSTCRVAI